jgi:hypothetical protein
MVVHKIDKLEYHTTKEPLLRFFSNMLHLPGLSHLITIVRLGNEEIDYQISWKFAMTEDH